MNQINDGRFEQLPSEYLAETRKDVSEAIEELIDVGARIRPLFAGEKQIGWARGIHLTERKMLKRWIFDENDFIQHLLRIGTTLTVEEIERLSMVELRSLSRVIRSMTESDMKLYPYISAFVTTSMSEQLWYARGPWAPASVIVCGRCRMESRCGFSPPQTRRVPEQPCAITEVRRSPAWRLRSTSSRRY